MRRLIPVLDIALAALLLIAALIIVPIVLVAAWVTLGWHD